MQISSTIAFRTKPSLCYSSHDYYLLNHRFNTTQSCTCCSFPTLGVPSNPRFFYDSTLIRSLITKKLILSRKNQFLRQPLCNFDSLNAECCTVRRSCECCCNRRRENECCKRYCDSSSNFDKVFCGNSCNGRDSFSCCNMNVNVNGRIRKQGRLKCLIWEDRSESCDSGGGGNIDEMLDLLIVDKTSGGGGKRNSWLSDERVQVDRRGRFDGREREKYGKSSYGQRDSRDRFESSGVKTKEKECRFCGKGDAIIKGKSNGLRKEGLNYSVLESDEVEKSDVDMQVNHGRRSEVSLSRNKKDLKRFDEDVSVKNVIEQSTKSNYDAMGSTSAVATSDHRSRNEREKKFTDVSNLREDSQLESSNVMDSRRRDSETRLATQNRLSDRQDDSGLATYLIDETRLQISQQGGLRRDSQRLTERSKIQHDDIEQTSISNARFRQREETSAASMNVYEKKEERYSQASQSTAELQRKSSNVMGTRRRDSGIRDTTESRLSDRQDNLGLNTYLIDETRSQISQQDELRRDSQQLTERSQIKNNDIEQTSISKARFRQREETSAASMNMSEKKEELYSQTSQSIAELQRKSQLSESESRDNHIRNTSISHTRFESASKNREDNSTSSFQEAEKKEMHSDWHLRDIKITEQDQNLSDMSVISGNDKEIKNTSQKVIERRTHPEEEISASYVSQLASNRDSDIRRTSTSQRLSESVLKNREERSTSLLASVSEAEERNQTADRVAWDLKSTKYSEDPKHTSETTSYDTTISSDSNKYFERKMSSRQENSSSLIDWGTEDGAETQQVTYPIKQAGSRIHSERLTETSIFQESSANRSSSSQSSVLNQQKIEQQRDEQMEFGRTLQVMVTPPPSQILHRTSSETVLHQSSNTGNTAGVVYSETADSSSSTIYTEEITPSSPHDFIGQTSLGNNNQSLSNVMLHADVLGSANRLEESSTQFFGQFVEELNQEASTSELAVGKISSEPSSINKDAEDSQHALNQHVPDDVRSQVHDSRKSSSSSGARGPSDKVWDIAGPYSEERARDEDTSEVSSTTKTAIGRTNRSLWGIIGDIVRLRWRARSEARTPSTKSRGKSSSNQSVGSEGWFSSPEVDEKSDENVKKGKIIMPKLPGNSDQPLKTEAEPLGGVSEGTSADNTVLVTEADRFTSLDIVKGGTSASSTSKVESQRVDDKSNQGITSSTPTPSTSSPLPSIHFMRSPAVRGEVFVSSKAMSSRSDSGQMEQLVQKRPTEGSGTEMKDGELKQRKLHRNKQVEKETFEDWEEAYRIESEQRIIDEMFMKEAILEAKKAADTWEVPVGAVLVQHGKIIARGCNLVEELRDSTAHAEMICIREASKTLQTWRLAETTLYVTLEPCAMCAGAILQSRIDTVVYGAPNKLLGADGSWVRLFPGGSDAGGSSDLTSQLGGPVHPFHPKITLRRGILATECADVMQQFFQLRRKKAKKSDSPPPPPSSSSRILSHPSTLISKMHHIFNVMFCL